MKIALIGYGKMGRMIEQIALERGHSIVSRIDTSNLQDMHSAAFRQADVAIEFTTPQTAEGNIRAAWAEGLPVVSGTTGWQAALPALQTEAQAEGHLLFWTSNFSLGVNLFFRLNKQLAVLMQPYSQYAVSIEEVHHIHKLDAPSGTAVTLAEGIEHGIQNTEHKTAASSEAQRFNVQERRGSVSSSEHWVNEVPITSIRTGEVPGTHTVRYESEEDSISIRHEAKSRRGFALGAVLAAEFLVKQREAGKTGFFDMNDLLE